MSNAVEEKQSWGSAFGFIMSSIGYAVGVGAVWKFPYMIGSNGGGVFLLFCIIFMTIICIPMAWAELALGRYTQKSAIVGMKDLAGESTPWQLLGWFGFAAGYIMVDYYITIVADVLFYVFKFVSGGLAGMSIDEMAAYYNNDVNGSPMIKIGMTLVMWVITTLVLWFGVQGGLEVACKILIPSLFIFLVILAIRGFMLPGGMDGIVWMFTPDFSYVNASFLLAVLNQCFFLAGCGLASLFSFGSYLDAKDSDIPFNGTVIIFSNIVVAILAGMAIFPALFSYGMDVTAGSGLVFMTLPYVFNDMAMGTLWGALFFILLFAAGWSSCLGLFEGSVSVISDVLKWPRRKALIVLAILGFIISVPAALAYTPILIDFKIMGMDALTFMDFLAICIFCPLSGMLISIYAAYKWPFSEYMAQVNIGAKYFKAPGGVIKHWMGICIPVICIILMVTGIMAYLGL